MFTEQRRQRKIFAQKYFWQKNQQRSLKISNYGSYTICSTFINSQRTGNRDLQIVYKVTFVKRSLRSVESWIPESRPPEESIPSSLEKVVKLYLSFSASSHVTNPFSFPRLNGEKTYFLKFPPLLPWKSHFELQLLSEAEYNGKGGNANLPKPLNGAPETQRWGRHRLIQRNGHVGAISKSRKTKEP